MNTILTLFDRSLTLRRYPAHLQDKNEQAWDAADELLIGELQDAPAPSLGKVWILNDDCGALTSYFSHFEPIWIGDSKVSQLACEQNLALNHIAPAQVTFYDSLHCPDDKPDWVLIKIPKTLALLEHQLQMLQSKVNDNTRVVASGKVQLIQKSTLTLFEKYLGPTKTSLAKKKARLVFCTPQAHSPLPSTFPTSWPLAGTPFVIHNHANVFARQQLDIGARFLLEHMPDCQGKKVIDLGCGNGVLGLSILQRFAEAQVIFVDESFMAVESARLNVQSNLPERMKDCEFVVSNCLEQLNDSVARTIDLVLCNPPFHQQNRITDHIAWQMFNDAKQALKPGGELCIVGNRHLDYFQKLKRLFGGCRLVAGNAKFSILSASKR
ncbi:methyltransferase [Aliiglaciecola sp. CAU 1673]|uniref:methyltransferase n=1 Tax=Aliiglaciecola sp. CAU 1673 TaxID=3032595 RepID=UPI0023DB5057|nr:methyltransferase [Aliiglaciecola sp. CAU 1673]MDF2176784.1 methyltransferase [Aliiglaciecola sp. CAU 1673]